MAAEKHQTENAEIGGQNYEMAGVVCSICGDKGHAAPECKVVAEKHQKENADWTAEVELDTTYIHMITELRYMSDTESAFDTLNYSIIKGRSYRIMWSQCDPSLRKLGRCKTNQ